MPVALVVKAEAATAAAATAAVTALAAGARPPACRWAGGMRLADGKLHHRATVGGLMNRSLSLRAPQRAWTARRGGAGMAGDLC